MNKPEIIEKNKDFLVVYKPAGISVQTARPAEMDLEHWLLGELSKEEDSPYLAVVHRLDQPVEGLLLFARNRQAAAAFSEQIQNQKMTKTYLAVTDRTPEHQQGHLIDYLKKDCRSNSSHVVPQGTPGGKKAELLYQCLETSEDGRTLIKIRLLTGRHHQIRVQMAHAGIPLTGDVKYGEGREKGNMLGLCACGLQFQHPKTGKWRWFSCCPRGKQFQMFDCPIYIDD